MQHPQMRIARYAVLIDAATVHRWHAHASSVPGLPDLERAILDAVARHHRDLRDRGYARPLTYAVLGQGTQVRPMDIARAIHRLVDRGLIAVRPGRGSRASTYTMAMPSRAAAVSAAHVEAPPF